MNENQPSRIRQEDERDRVPADRKALEHQMRSADRDMDLRPPIDRNAHKGPLNR